MTCCTGAPARRYPSTGGPKIRSGDLSTASQTSVFNLEQKEDHAESHFKTLGLYNFTRDFGWACKRGSLYPAGGLISGIKKNLSERRDKTYLRNELKLRYHYILSYIYNIFIVRHNKQRMYLKNIYKTDLCDCLKQTQKEHTYTVAGLISRWAYIRNIIVVGKWMGSKDSVTSFFFLFLDERNNRVRVTSCQSPLSPTQFLDLRRSDSLATARQATEGQIFYS